jgi:predicted nucleotidyltransferase
VYSVESGIYHYRSMAKTNYRGYLLAPQVPLKKYFYALRPLLSVRWLEQFDKPAPIEFDKLREVIEGESELQQAIDELLAIKRASPEMGLSPQIMPIQQFIERELHRLEAIKPTRRERKEIEPLLSELFRSVLKETWE